MINLIENFLEKDKIDYVLEKYQSSKGKPVFEINEFGRWDPSLLEGNYGPVYMLPMPELDEFFIEKFQKVDPIFSNYKLGTVFLQIWTNGSGINWHHDDENGGRIAATIYLNDYWNLNWGGLLLYQYNEGKNWGWMNPHKNRCVWFKSPLWHSVSLITRAATEPRISIQIFFDRN